MRILIIGRYDTSYSRNAILMRGLQLQNIQFDECRVQPGRAWSLSRLVWQFLQHRAPYDVILVLFPGQEVVPWLRFCTRKPILFDAFTSHYEGYIQDRKIAPVVSVRSLWYRFIDWLSCRLADRVLVDTNAHAKYFSDTYRVPASKMETIYLGSMLSEREWPPIQPTERIIHFHGSNIPLQGIGVIFDAIRLLKSSGLQFQMVGPFAIPADLSGVVTHYPRVAFKELAQLMERSRVCLGIFGSTLKAQRVIPNKVYEAIACRRPVITGDTPAMRELFNEDSIRFVPLGSARALASAIEQLVSDTVRANEQATAAYARLLDRATPDIVGKQLRTICDQLSLRA